MQPRRTALPSLADAAYLAGLIDGEGTISLTRLHRGQNRQLTLSISSTERQLLEWVAGATQVGKITSKRVSQPHHAPGFTFAVANRQALAVLEQVAPYLRSYKLGRAQLVLALYLPMTPRNGKYDEATRSARVEFERQFAAISIRQRPETGKTVRGIASSRPCPRLAHSGQGGA